ncbi:MAG: hypothetical protein FWE36_00375 [Erysipelotrichales bacterium]|nr:hypothetical protein [Erysipelotrichales bacterium]
MKKIISLILLIIIFIGMPKISAFWRGEVNHPDDEIAGGEIITGRFNLFSNPSYISAGNGYNIIIDYFGRLWSFGSNINGRTGLGVSEGGTLNPTLIDTEDTRFRRVYAGQNFSLAIDTEGRLWSWGSNANGRTGLGLMTGNTLEPQMIDTNQTRFISISSNNDHSVAICTDNNLWTWGANASGRTGHGTSAGNTLAPRMVETISGIEFKMAVAGNSHTLALCIDGYIYSFGFNQNGRTGQGLYQGNLTIPTRINTGSTRFITVAAGENMGIAIDTLGRLWSWGSNIQGRIGLGSDDSDVLTPHLIETNGVAFEFISTGITHSVLIDNTGRLWSFGNNAQGRTGLGVITNAQLQPILINSVEDRDFLKVTTGNDHNLALTQEGILYSFGNNASGRTGLGTTGGNRITPLPLLGHN